MKLYSIKDVKIGYMTPFTLQNDNVALRVFEQAIKDEGQNNLNKYPYDMELWCIGTWDETTGYITPETYNIASGKDFVKKGTTKK